MKDIILVPVYGALEILVLAISDQYEEKIVRGLLDEDVKGTQVGLTLRLDDQPNAKVSFISGPDIEENEAANAIVTYLTGGVHLKITGTAVFTGLASETVEYLGSL